MRISRALHLPGRVAQHFITVEDGDLPGRISRVRETGRAALPNRVVFSLIVPTCGPASARTTLRGVGVKSKQVINMRKDLSRVLSSVGKETREIVFADGTHLLILPHGGRVISVCSPATDTNYLWTNPLLDTAQGARALFSSREWQNSGGDRTWIAPEVDIFFPDYPDLSIVRHQTALDPGHYSVMGFGESIELVNRFKLHFSRAHEALELEIRKSWSAAPNPLRLVGEEIDSVEYAGYTQTTELRSYDAPARTGARYGLWNIVQLPHGGEMLIPTYSRTAPKVFEGSVSGDDLRVSDRLVRFRMASAGLVKIGVSATHGTGRIGYVYSSGQRWALVIRNFLLDPSSDYVDVSWASPEDLADAGYATQACAVNNEIGCFSELEYHAPAIGGEGASTSRDFSQLWAFRGTAQSVRKIARLLLSPEV